MSRPPSASLELIQDWTLTTADVQRVLVCRGDDKRLRFAIQLCHLRSRGCWLASYPSVDASTTNYVARQLGLPPTISVRSPERRQTDRDHRAQVRSYLGFRVFDGDFESELEERLRDEARKQLSRSVLSERAEAQLLDWKVVRPARTTLERIISRAIAAVDLELFNVVAARMGSALKERLDKLLLVAKNERLSPLIKLRGEPKTSSAQTIIRHVERFESIVGFEVDSIRLEPLTKAQISHFSERVIRLKADALARYTPAKRHTLLACFVVEARGRFLDELVALTDRFLIEFERKSKRRHSANTRQATVEAKKALVIVLSSLERMMDVGVDATATRQALLKEFGDDGISDALTTCRALETKQTRAGVDEICEYHSELKKVLSRFLKLPLQVEPGSKAVAKAINIARKLSTGALRKLPTDAPKTVIPARWRSNSGPPDRKLWETGLAFTIRDLLRAGDIYIPKSRHHRALSSLLLESERWEESRQDFLEQLAVPAEADKALEVLGVEHDRAARTFAQTLSKNRFVAVVNGKLEFRRDAARVIPPRVKQLRKYIQSELPFCRIESLMLDVDSWTGFTDAFVPLPGYNPARRPQKKAILAALLAHGANLELVVMAACTEGVDLVELEHVTRWYLRPETLKAANRLIVNFQARALLAQVWGGGLSSSDGQRFAVQAKSSIATYYPSYFGHYRRAVSIYTHVSDTSSVYATKVISCGPYEAPHVLDGLLENDTEIDTVAHSVDTGGSTEQLFGLCHLLGFAFHPRLADLAARRLYRATDGDSFGSIDVLFNRTIKTNLITEQWDQMLRVAASLKAGTVPAHVLVARLSSGSRTSRLAKALTELGRLVETTFILKYLADSDLRRAIHRQLNIGESRHALAKHLRIGNHGVFRTGDIEQLVNKANALSLLSNSVVAWNTAKIQTTLSQLEGAGGRVEKEHLSRITPLAHGHVLPFGTYRFDAP